MIPDLTLEERVNYIKNHFGELFKTESYFLGESKRNIEIFLERFLEKTTLQKLGDKNNIRAARVRQIAIKVERKIEKSKFFSFGHKAPEEPAILGNTPIARLELNIRAENCLRSIGIRTIGDLLPFCERYLLETPNLGKKSLNEIKAALAGQGLRLGLEYPLWDRRIICSECHNAFDQQPNSDHDPSYFRVVESCGERSARPESA